jgi:tetratricopeptide (TPR) repeat protein
VNALPLLLVLALAAPPELKRARDRFEFGAWADAAGTLRQLLSSGKPLTEEEAVEAYRMLGIAEYHLGDLPEARSAFLNLLSNDPDYGLDPFLVPPPIVETFDAVKRENEEALAPLREQKRALREQARLAEEARRRLLAEAPPTKVVRVQERLYLLNWVPFGAGQFQNGDRAKGVALAAGQIVTGAVNVGAIIAHAQLADNLPRCTSAEPDCSDPPYSDSDRQLLRTVDVVKYVSAGLFWALYAYGVWDAHRNFVPIVETEITPARPGVEPGATLKLGVGLRF